MLECPECGEPEILRKRVGDEQGVVFSCMLSVILPADCDDVELQRRLDEWKRTGKLEEWLKTPLFDPSNRFTVITDPDVIDKAKRKFDELRKNGEEL